jgi:FkbM family methyltransferase
MIEQKIGFVDVGARGGTDPKLEPFHGRLIRVLVEPAEEEAERLRSTSDGGRKFIVIGSALGNLDGEMDLFVTKNPTCTSALKVNYELLDNYSIVPHFRLKERLRIPCARYDTLYDAGGLPVPHAVKLDVQGFEYQVLQGFGRHLNDCLALKLETHFYPIYQDQRTIGEIIRFLSAHDFVLRSLSNPRSPALSGDKHFDGDLVEVDAFFTKSKQWISQRDKLVKNNFRLACAVLGIDLYATL